MVSIVLCMILNALIVGFFGILAIAALTTFQSGAIIFVILIIAGIIVTISGMYNSEYTSLGSRIARIVGMSLMLVPAFLFNIFLMTGVLQYDFSSTTPACIFFYTSIFPALCLWLLIQIEVCGRNTFTFDWDEKAINLISCLSPFVSIGLFTLISAGISTQAEFNIIYLTNMLIGGGCLVIVLAERLIRGTAFAE